MNTESIKTAKEKCIQKLSIYAECGWKLKMKEAEEDELINESMFFYPLVGMLKELTDAICDQVKKDNQKYHSYEINIKLNRSCLLKQLSACCSKIDKQGGL